MDADTLSKAFSPARYFFKGNAHHVSISHLLIEGVHAKIVSERAGHAHVNITIGVYAAYIPTMQADVARRVDAWLR